MPTEQPDVNRLEIPRLEARGARAATLTRLYQNALDNVRSNIVPDPESSHSAFYVRAGAGYQDPWTRDASINAWFAGSLIDPENAEHTLARVTEDQPGGRVLAQDNQWWDQAIWIIGAWNHFLITGSEEFLSLAYGIADRSLTLLRASHFDEKLGLYLGPGFMQDGISGLPTPPNDRGLTSSFVLDYPAAWSIATLSTNAIYVGAYTALAAMARKLAANDSGPLAEARRLTQAIRQHFLESDKPAYFVHRNHSGRVHRDPSVEAAGIALAALFNVFTAAEAKSHLAQLWHEPAGVVNVWPHFADRYTEDRPGRHNVLCWPVVMGLVNLACLKIDADQLFHRGLDNLMALFSGSGYEFFETYEARTGQPRGGWQVGREWESLPHQTWSATAFLASVHFGLAGLECRDDGLAVRPRLPEGIDSLSLHGVRYRDSLLTIVVERTDADRNSTVAFVPSNTSGTRTIHATVPK